MEIVEDVVIVGAGIAGLATALALKRLGVRALVLERAKELRTTGAALTLMPNAWLALDALGISHKLTSIYAPFSKGTFTNVSTGDVQEVFFAGLDAKPKKEHGPRTVHRKVLLETLAQELSTDSIRFCSKITAIDNKQEGGALYAIVHLEDGPSIKSKVLIGCDGVHSVVAHWLGLAAPAQSGRYGVRGLAYFPEGHGFSHEVRQFIDEGKRGGVVPLNDKEVYWFLACQSPEGELTRDPELIQKEIIEKYAADFPPAYLDVVRHAQLSSVTWASLIFRYPWNIIFGKLNKGNVTVAGDAMHPMTPDLGQGGCAALEDAVVLGRHIGNSILKNGRFVAKDMPAALDGYVKERRWRAALLITGSYFSGRAQQGGSSWWMKFLRDSIFYKYLFHRISKIGLYDCGKLPLVSNKQD